jgi:transcriptional regulator with XRE-family HTH domain
MVTDPSFGIWLRERRRRRGWSQREVERRTRESYGLRLSNGHLSQIETDKRPPPTISPRILFALAALYELDVLEMLDRLGSSAGLQLSYRQNGAFVVPQDLPDQDGN